MDDKKCICKVCGKLKLKIRARTYKYEGYKFYAYRDEDSLMWNGKVCGSCNRLRAKNNMQTMRKRRAINGDEI